MVPPFFSLLPILPLPHPSLCLLLSTSFLLLSGFFFSLSLIFCSLTMILLGIAFLAFILLSVRWASWICGLRSEFNLREILRHISSVSFSFFFVWCSYYAFATFVIVPWFLNTVIFFTPFYFCYLVWDNIFNYLHTRRLFPQSCLICWVHRKLFFFVRFFFYF